MEIAVLIPAYQPDSVLISLVQALHRENFRLIVTDDGSGTLSAEVSDDSIVFTNHYTPAGTGTDTGDDSGMAVALGLMMMAATAGGAVLVRRKIKQ